MSVIIPPRKQLCDELIKKYPRMLDELRGIIKDALHVSGPSGEYIAVIPNKFPEFFVNLVAGEVEELGYHVEVSLLSEENIIQKPSHCIRIKL